MDPVGRKQSDGIHCSCHGNEEATKAMRRWDLDQETHEIVDGHTNATGNSVNHKNKISNKRSREEVDDYSGDSEESLRKLGFSPQIRKHSSYPQNFSSQRGAVFKIHYPHKRKIPRNMDYFADSPKRRRNI